MENNEILKMYEQAQHEEILILGKSMAIMSFTILPLFYFKDVYMTKYTQSTFIWRFLPMLGGLIFFILRSTKYKNNLKVMKYYYIALLYSILIMIFGIFYVNYGELNGKFNSFLIAGLITTMLAIHLFSAPIRKYIAIFPISTIIFFLVLFRIKGGDLFVISNLLNPILIIIFVWVMSIRLEKHNFSEFKSKFLLELNERDLKNEIEYRKSIEAQLKEEIILEPLTGVYNRRAAEKIIPEKIKEAADHPHKFALVYIDIDNLKNINDHDGHDAGDVLLKNFTSTCKELLSEEDLIFKIGGDEFIILFMDQYLTETHKIIDDISLSCKENNITFSYGVSIIKDNKNADMSTLIKEADIKMYNQKKRKKKAPAN